MNRLRICHVITRLELGGAQDNTLTTVESLPDDRYETFLISGPGGMLDARARDRLGPRCQFIPSLVRPVCPIRDTLAFCALKRLFRAGRYDIVHTHSSKAGVLGRLAARAAGVPIVIHTAHGWGFHDGQWAPVRQLFAACERVAARSTDRIVAVSDATSRKGLSAGIGRAEQYVVIRSGIDPRPYQTPADAVDLKRKLNLDPARPIVLMPACLKPQKSPLDFIEVAAKVKPSVPSAQFVLAGDGDLRPAVEERIRRLDVRDSVRLMGWRSDIADLLRASDLLALTSRWEGLPRVFLEAIAAGVPIVATSVDGAPEAIADGVNGYLASPGDTSGMARRISELLLDPAKHAAFKSAARSSWKEEYDIRDMVRRLDRLYQDVWTRTHAGWEHPRKA